MSKSETKALRTQRNAPRPQSDSRVVAVFHATQDGFVGLIGRRAGHAIDVIATREFAKGDAGASAWADENLAARRIVVLPSASVIVRAVQFPRAPEEKLASALELNATTFVLGRTPEFRVAAAILPGERGEANLRTGIVAEWPLDQPAPPLPLGMTEKDRLSFAPEIAALAALAGASGEPLVAIDAAHGAVSVAAPSTQGVLVRIVRAGGEDAGVESEEIGRAVGEACVHSSVPAAEISQIVERTCDAARDALAGGFGCTPSTMRDLAKYVRVPAQQGGSAWWRVHGVAAGTALAALGSGAPLTQLQSQDPGAKPDRAGAVLNRIAEPKMASRLLIAALLTIAFGPLAFQGVRLLVLNWKLPDVAAYEKAESTDVQKRALYRMLARNASSMTKTMSDIAAAAPAGIEVDFINLSQSIKGQSVTIRGKAGPIAGHPGTEAILEMEQLLRKSGMFEGLTRSSEPPNQGGWQDFSINALAVRPTDIANYPPEQNYGPDGKSMRIRKWGEMPENVDPSEKATATTTADAETPSAAGSTNGTASPTRGSTTRVATSAGSVTTPSGAVTTPPGTVTTPSGTVTAPPGTATPVAAGATPAATAAGKDAAGKDAAGATPPPPPPPAAGATGTETPAAGTEGADGKTPRGTRNPSGKLGMRGSALGGGSSEPEPPPTPLTEAEISKMTKAEAQAALTTVSKARQRADISDEVKARLKSEFEMLLERCKKD